MLVTRFYLACYLNYDFKIKIKKKKKNHKAFIYTFIGHDATNLCEITIIYSYLQSRQHNIPDILDTHTILPCACLIKGRKTLVTSTPAIKFTFMIFLNILMGRSSPSHVCPSTPALFTSPQRPDQK